MSSRLDRVKVISRLFIGALAALTLHCGGDSGGGVTPPTTPTIGLASSTATFNATAGGAAPASQEINISNTGGGTLDGLSAGVSYTSGQPTGWLNAALSATTAPSTLSLTAASGSLAPGTYTAQVAVTAGAATNSPQTISVTLTVAPALGGGSLIALSSTTQNFAAPQDGADPTPLTVDVTNGGDGTLDGLTATATFGAGQPAGWLTATLSATAAPSTLTLTATTGHLPAGSYTASVAVASPAAGNSPQTIAVTFTVAPPTAGPSIQLSTNTVSFNGIKGDTNPGPQHIAVANGGTGTLSNLEASLTFPAGQPTGWLTATLAKKTAPSALTLQASTATLDPGTYTATVSVASTGASNSPQTVAVTLTVAPPPPTLVMSDSSLTLTATEGATDPTPQTVDIFSGTTGTLNDLTAAVTYNQGSGWLEVALSSTSLPSTLAVTPHLAALGLRSALQAGTYTATIQLSSATASNSPQVVVDTLFVNPPDSALLYGVNSSSDALSIYDARNGNGRIIGPLDPNDKFTTPVAMAIRPTDLALFVWNNDGDLLTVDKATGVGTAVNTVGHGTLGGLAFSPNGVLYGVSDNALFTIDPNTGDETLVGALGSGIRPVGAADFGCDGVLYAVELNADSEERLLSIDTGTGAATPIATLSMDIGTIGSIAFSPSGTLVGSGFGTAGDILFDLGLNGTVSNVRSIAPSAGGAPQGMAFLRVCPF